VVVATGPFQVPFIPAIADALDPGVHQIHSAHYAALRSSSRQGPGRRCRELRVPDRPGTLRPTAWLNPGQRLPAIRQRPWP
jgi:hypothetical protein